MQYPFLFDYECSLTSLWANDKVVRMTEFGLALGSEVLQALYTLSERKLYIEKLKSIERFVKQKEETPLLAAVKKIIYQVQHVVEGAENLGKCQF